MNSMVSAAITCPGTMIGNPGGYGITKCAETSGGPFFRRLPIARSLQPAIRLAREGFPLYPHLQEALDVLQLKGPHDLLLQPDEGNAVEDTFGDEVHPSQPRVEVLHLPVTPVLRRVADAGRTDRREKAVDVGLAELVDVLG